MYIQDLFDKVKGLPQNEKTAEYIKVYLYNNLLGVEYGDLFDRAYISSVKAEKVGNVYDVYVEICMNKNVEFVTSESIAKIVNKYVKRYCKQLNKCIVAVEKTRGGKVEVKCIKMG